MPLEFDPNNSRDETEAKTLSYLGWEEAISKVRWQDDPLRAIFVQKAETL